MVRKIQIIVFVLAALGLFRVEFGNDLSRFHRMDPLMAEGEKAVAAAFGETGARFAVANLDAWQRENVALKAKMGVPLPGELLTAADLPSFMTLKLPFGDGIVLPVGFGGMELDLRAEMVRRFDAYAAETYQLLAISFAILIVLLAVIFRRRLFAYVMPIMAAVLSTAGVLGWMGETVNFFHLLCSFVLVGLGIDYTIFHRASFNTSRVVLFSFLTSLVGFGMLAFTSFQVTRSMGLMLGVGLFFAYVFSLPSKRVTRSSDWSKRPEQSAGGFRLAFLFLLYRIFGKSFVKVIIFFVVLFIYPFVRTLKFRVVLNFAWALMDKVDACSLQKNLPKMTVTGDQRWMKGGCFLLSTHVGTIEVLPALVPSAANRQSPIKVHAFQQMTHNRIFTDFFERWRDKSRFELHAVEEIGVETAVEMQAAIQRGEIVLMAGDREPASRGRKISAANGQRRKGVFVFAKLMECPVYAITCVRTGWNAYTVNAKRLGAELEVDYDAFLASAIIRYPFEHFDFH